ncbi:hypothetical protein Tdes44962_MAKER03148 [Teratosphaeria destructans]|uniref:Uncharacterized protein n=1 Tax=Teratosphaeria destructans TaxID=418781 RepID=A0A9W7SQR6_9PEZI|nr:hypothetical protein Tdes44962_MAKER03148 [Teratosphaeria destructans]
MHANTNSGPSLAGVLIVFFAILVAFGAIKWQWSSSDSDCAYNRSIEVLKKSTVLVPCPVRTTVGPDGAGAKLCEVVNTKTITTTI